MFYTYILYSALRDRYYVGQSKFRGKRRREHCREKKHWTRLADDWEEVYCQKVETREESRVLEMKIKKRGAKRFLSDIGR